ncbi:MAG: hypothetical protein ABIH23_35930 [bacterium]
MCQSYSHGSCFGCHSVLTRRHFLQGLGGAAATACAVTSMAGAAEKGKNGKVRVAAVFLANEEDSWPYPGFDTQARQQEVLALLAESCPQIEFVPVTIEQPDQAQKATSLSDQVDGYLVHAVTLGWAFRKPLTEIAQLGKPMVVVDEYLGGSGLFLCGYSGLCDQGLPAAAVSSNRPEDLVTVARQFADVREPGTTAESFARRCWEVYRGTFPKAGPLKCIEDPVSLTDIGECVKRFKESSFLIVGTNKSNQEQDFLGAKGIYLDFDELNALYEKVDRDHAAEWATRWSEHARKVVEPKSEPLQNAGGVYLATLELLKKYGTDSVTMNCLGGFAAGNLPAYPCLGFMEILNAGGQGVCEAMPDDTVSMLMARILTGRPGYVSDPVLDTSKNQIVYAHCVATTKAFGPQSESNPYDIRSLHNRDPRGACAQSFLPSGYMTTSFRTNVQRNQMVIHQAKAVGNVESERGCRTKMVAEMRGDIGKTFDQWSRFGWHRVTVYGDVKEPLMEFGKALGLEIIEEA